MSKEIWKKIEGTKSHFVSDLGRIKCTRGNKDKILKTWWGDEDSIYHYFKPTINGKRKRLNVHTAVLEAFICNRPIGMEARHLDGDKHNNSLKNLKWGTKDENIRDQISHGTHQSIFSPKGTNHSTAKLNKEQLSEVHILLGKGVSQARIGKMFNIAQSTISLINQGKRYAK